MIRSLLVVDVETTGVSPRSACIEAAVAVFDVKSAAVVHSFSSLIRAPATNPAYAVNRIPASLLAVAPTARSVWSAVARRAASCQAITSYNRSFDRRYVPDDVVGAAPWFCSCYDAAWPMSRKGVGLVALAADHGVPVGGAHRAFADVDTLCRLFAKVSETSDLGAFIDDALRKRASRPLP